MFAILKKVIFKHKKSFSLKFHVLFWDIVKFCVLRVTTQKWLLLEVYEMLSCVLMPLGLSMYM